MSESIQADVVVIGGGPGGYVAAIRAAQLGRQVVLVERAELGGICLNWGCIPTKALLRSAEMYGAMQHAGEYGLSATEVTFDYPAVVARSRAVSQRLSQGVGFLMKKNRVRVVQGTARLSGAKRVEVVDDDGNGVAAIAAEAVILATGAHTRDFPGMAIDGTRIIGSREALVLQEVPRRIAILGAGSIGVEFAHHFLSFGAEVHLFEALPRILPLADEDLSKELAKAFKKRGMKLYPGTPVTAVEKTEGGVVLSFERKGRPESLEADLLLMAVGVLPNSAGLGLEEVGVETDHGWVKVDSSYRTSVPGIYAIGDLVGQPCLAHVASAEAIVAVEHLCGHPVRPIDYGNIPACTYCSPQVASVGMTEAQAVAEGRDVRVGRFPLMANGKALALGETAGFVKAVVDGGDGALLGLHIIGAEATELLLEFTLGRSLQATARDLLGAIHPHPTLGESLHEAVAAALNEAIHL